jgi:peptide/nickel transport system permease protein
MKSSAPFRRLLLKALVMRAALLVLMLAVGGLLAASLVRWAPGFGMDERLLDARLDASSRQALEQQRAEGSDVLRYYQRYLRRLWHGDLGNSVGLGRPVRELLSERCWVSVQTGLAGVGLAWGAALVTVVVLKLAGAGSCETLASMAAGALLCVPTAAVALVCVYLGGAPSFAVAAIVFSRIFRYLRNIVNAAVQAPHVLAAHALGMRPGRLLTLHVLAPVTPELLALAGVSISMAVGALIPVEALCDSPGVGQLVWQAALGRDLPLLVNVTLLITALTAGANMLADSMRQTRQAWV